MDSSPAPPESLGKAGDSEVSQKSLSRFKALTGMLIATDPECFKEALEKDKAERIAKRSR